MTNPVYSQIGNSLRPRNVFEQKYTAAPGGSAAGYKKIYVMGERLATGTSTANEVKATPFADADDAIAWFGEGSFGAWLATQVFRGGRLSFGGCYVYGVAITEPAGVAASQTFTFATTTTSAGTFTINYAGTKVSWSVDSGTDATAAGDAMVEAIGKLDADNKPPFTPVNAIGVVTATANNKGACANTAPAEQIITGDEPAGMSLTVGGNVFASGTLYPSLTTALANMEAVVTPLIVHGWDETPDGSTTNLDVIRDHLITKCAAEVGHRGAQVFAMCKPSATLISDRAALDDDDAERCRMGGMDYTVASTSPPTWHVSAAGYMANAWGQQIDVAYPYNNVSLPYMGQPTASGDILGPTEIDVLLEAAICPLTWSVERGRYLMIQGNSCRLFNGRPQAWGIVDSIDWLRYNLQINCASAFPPGTKLAEDGETNLDENTTTPAGVLDVFHDTIFAENMRGILRNRETLWSAAYAAIHPSITGRVDVSVDVAVMDGLNIIAGLIRQRGGIIGNEQ
jgi:phage tail sheath gpL-like